MGWLLLMSQALLVDEQRAEIGLLKAKLRRVEGKTESLGGARVSMVGDAVAPTSSGFTGALSGHATSTGSRKRLDHGC